MWQNINLKYKIAIIAALVLIFALVAFSLYTHLLTPDNTQTMTVEEIKQPELVAEKIGVSKSVAKQIVNEIEEVVKHPPATSYTVPAETTEEAAKIVEKQIRDDKVPVELPPADKTIVTPTDVNVKVYRINLEAKKLYQASYYADKSWDVSYSRKIAKHIYAGPVIKSDNDNVVVGIRVTYAK